MKQKSTAGIFALLLGGIGLHKFYLGKTGQGFLYLFFCWTFIPVIISIFEGIGLLSMSEIDFARKYNEGMGAVGNIDVADELSKLAALKTQQIITEEEFQLRKNKLLKQ